MRASQRMPLIRVSSLNPVVRALDRRGVFADALLSRHQMARDQLDNPYAEVPLARYIAFLEAAADAAGDPGFGAATGTAFGPATLGPVGLYFGASSTLRRGLERLVQTLTTWQDGTSIGLHDEDGALV